MDDVRQIQLETLLRRLASDYKLLESEELRREVTTTIQTIYRDSWRHRYSSIFTVLMELHEENEDSFNILTTNFENLVSNYDRTSDTYRSLYKLYDHVALDIARINCWGDRDKDVYGRLQDAERKVDLLQSRLISAKTALDNAQAQYVALLGIFASIVLTVSGSISFSNSIFNNLSNASAFSIALASLFQLFLLINLVYCLTYTVTRLNTNEILRKAHYRWIFTFNIIVAILILTLLLFRSECALSF